MAALFCQPKSQPLISFWCPSTWEDQPHLPLRRLWTDGRGQRPVRSRSEPARPAPKPAAPGPLACRAPRDTRLDPWVAPARPPARRSPADPRLVQNKTPARMTLSPFRSPARSYLSSGLVRAITFPLQSTACDTTSFPEQRLLHIRTNIPPTIMLRTTEEVLRRQYDGTKICLASQYTEVTDHIRTVPSSAYDLSFVGCPKRV